MRPFFCTFAILSLSAAAAHAGQKDVQRCWDREGSDTEVIEVCTRALNLRGLNDGERAGIHASRALAYERDGNNTEALTDLNHAIALEPYEGSRRVFQTRRAFNLFMLKNYDLAIADYSDALTRKPDDTHLLYFRGLSYLRRGDAARGFTDLDRMVALNPDAQSYLNRADAYVAHGDNDKALTDFDKAIALNPDDAEAHLKRATVYEGRGDTDSAIADFTRATELQPNAQSGFLRRAVLYERLGERDLALKDYERLLELAPGEGFYRERRERLLGATGGPPALMPPTVAKTPEPEPTAPIATAPEPSPAPEHAIAGPAPLPEKPAAATSRAPSPILPPKVDQKTEVAAEVPIDCKVFVPAANMTVTIPCGK